MPSEQKINFQADFCRDYYQEKVAACTEKIRRVQNKLNAMAVIRLALFAGFVYSVYTLFQHISPSRVGLAFALLGAFIACVNIYYHWKDQRRLLEKLRFVTENEIALLTGKPNSFADGADLLDSRSYLDDLDIFGPHSLFHVLNRTTTAWGKDFLAASLRHPLLDPAAIRAEQDAIRTFATQTDLRQRITAHGLLNEDRHSTLDTASFRVWLETAPRIYQRPLTIVALALLIVFNLFAIGTWIVSNNYTLLLTGVIVSRLVLVAFGRYTAKQHQLIDHKQPLLDQYAGILSAFNAIDPGNSTVLDQLRQRTGKAQNAIRRLARLANSFDHRMNGLVNLFLNTFFLYDLHCVFALERWKNTFRTGFLDWLEAIAPVERLNSLATFAFNHPDYAYPTPVEPSGALHPPPPPDPSIPINPPSLSPPTLYIEARRLAHPLIPAARRIANDCTIGRGERLILITGSNMSGKTTFLRTMGVNLLMAQCGLPVCAESFSFTPMQLLTSLRIDDSLLEQTSYFMAELKKLQHIVHRLRTGEPALVLIDEILRGTNSEDKTFGSEQFIRQLLQYHCCSLFATHDLTLGALESPGAVSNYCFESIIENGELHFNYQLQRGIARNRNASFLMKKMDII